MAKHAHNTQHLPATSADVQFAIMAMQKNEIATILRENLGSEDLSARDLPQICVPAGGGTMFSIPGIDGVAV
jgi:hypothetical protein